MNQRNRYKLIRRMDTALLAVLVLSIGLAALLFFLIGMRRIDEDKDAQSTPTAISQDHIIALTLETPLVLTAKPTISPTFLSTATAWPTPIVDPLNAVDLYASQSFILTGQALPGDRIVVLNQGDLIARDVANRHGEWQVSFNEGLLEGVYALMVAVETRDGTYSNAAPVRLLVQARPTATATYTVTPSLTATPSPTPTSTSTLTALPSATFTPTAKHTQSPSVTPSERVTQTPSSTATSTALASATSTETVITEAQDPTQTATVMPSETVTQTPSSTATSTVLASATSTATATETAITEAQDPTQTATVMPSETVTQTPSSTATSTTLPSVTSTVTVTEAQDPTQTVAVMPSETLTQTPSSTTTSTMLPSATSTVTATETVITEAQDPTQTATVTQTQTSTATITETAITEALDRTQTAMPSETLTQTPSSTATSTVSPSATSTSTQTAIPSETPTQTPSSTATSTVSPSSTLTLTQTATVTPSETPTQTPSMTPTLALTVPKILIPQDQAVLAAGEILISGQAEANQTLELVDETGEVLATIRTNASGQWSSDLNINVAETLVLAVRYSEHPEIQSPSIRFTIAPIIQPHTGDSATANDDDIGAIYTTLIAVLLIALGVAFIYAGQALYRLAKRDSDAS